MTTRRADLGPEKMGGEVRVVRLTVIPVNRNRKKAATAIAVGRGAGGVGGEEKETRPDTRPHVANLSHRSLVGRDGRTHRPTDGQTKRFIESLIRDYKEGKD